ncbi:MAG: pentapeptide repeat-containing protein [Chloroflexota bacterium]|nr:pentapeptide repeat-containing protein [Chloroflexota bacterium]
MIARRSRNPCSGGSLVGAVLRDADKRAARIDQADLSRVNLQGRI